MSTIATSHADTGSVASCPVCGSASGSADAGNSLQCPSCGETWESYPAPAAAAGSRFKTGVFVVAVLLVLVLGVALLLPAFG